MKKIDISTKKYPNTFALVDDEDYERANKYRWTPRKATTRVYAHRQYRVNGKRITIHMHRYILNYEGQMDIDHINHNCLDNRKENLRFATRSQNMMNMVKKSHTSSIYKGVTRFEKGWCASITKNYKINYLGYFKTQEEAAMVYNVKAIDLFGEFANLNIIKEVG